MKSYVLLYTHKDTVYSPGPPHKESGLTDGPMGKNIENTLSGDGEEMLKWRSLSRDSVVDLIRYTFRFIERVVLDIFNTRDRVSTVIWCFSKKGHTETEKYVSHGSNPFVYC
jgi:hypothetical protein